MTYAFVASGSTFQVGRTDVSSPAVGADADAVAVARRRTVLLRQLLVTKDYFDSERRFRALADEWRQSTRWLSSIHTMVANPAYLEIVGMGRPALPLILAELRKDPDHWFPALVAISGENPVSEADAGDLRKMTSSWLEWGRQRRLVK
jgi:hypothetical protein